MTCYRMELNTTSGSELAGVEDVIGPFGAGDPNDNALMTGFTFVCATVLSVMGLWYSRLDIDRWT